MHILSQLKRQQGFKYINYHSCFDQKRGTWGACQAYEVVKFVGKKGLIVKAHTSTGQLCRMSLRVNGSYQFVGCPTYEEGVGYPSDTQKNFILRD